MIRVNLLTEKRKKSISVVNYLPIFVVILGLGAIAAGWFIGEDYMSTFNDEYKQEEQQLDSDIKKQSSKVSEKESLRKKSNSLQNEINRLIQLSGANLVQWSQTLSSLTSRVPEKTVWITNLRIDSDRRVQITAYSCNEDGKEEPKEGGAKLTKGIQKFIEALLGSPYFQEVFLTSATKNIYEKMPVWRFEINCRLARELASKSED